VLLLPASIAALLTAAVILGTPGWSVASARPPAVGASMPAAAPVRAVAPTTVRKGKLAVTVDPAQDIGTSGSAVTVTGTGFTPGKNDLWVAICQDGGGAPKDLTRCLGGPIPDGNASTSWGIVTENAGQAPPGPVVVPWGDDGFTVKLQVAGGADRAADCVARKCSVFVRAAEKASSQDVTVPIAFAAPPGSSTSSVVSSTPTSSPSTSASATASSTSASTTAPSSTSVSSTAASSSASSSPTASSVASTTPASATPSISSTPSASSASATSSAGSSDPVPTTVPAQSVLLKQVRQGDEQVVVFTGFQPGEQATVSIVASPSVDLPQATADAGGRFRISWKVPGDFPVRRYSMRLEGLQSLKVGLADFSVVARLVPSSSASNGSTAQSPTSSAQIFTSSAAGPTSSAAAPAITASSAPTTTAPTTTAAPTSAVPNTAGSGRVSTPWWLWILLAAVLLVALVVGAVAMGRRHRTTAEADLIARQDELSDAAEVQIIRATPPLPPVMQPPVPPEYDEHPDRPILFSHRQAEQYSPPTELIGDPDAPTTAIRTTSGVPQRQNPTGEWKPDFTDDAQGQVADSPGARPPGEFGPGTQQFNPFADDRTGESTPADGSTGPDRPGRPGNDPGAQDGQDRGHWEPPGR
jgi:hypothetical protein